MKKLEAIYQRDKEITWNRAYNQYKQSYSTTR